MTSLDIRGMREGRCSLKENTRGDCLVWIDGGDSEERSEASSIIDREAWAATDSNIIAYFPISPHRHETHVFIETVMDTGGGTKKVKNPWVGISFTGGYAPVVLALV